MKTLRLCQTSLFLTAEFPIKALEAVGAGRSRLERRRVALLPSDVVADVRVHLAFTPSRAEGVTAADADRRVLDFLETRDETRAVRQCSGWVILEPILASVRREMLVHVGVVFLHNFVQDVYGQLSTSVFARGTDTQERGVKSSTW